MPPILRAATEDDAAAIQAIYAPYVRDTCISFETDPPSVDDIRDRMRRITDRHPWLVCEHDSRLLGYAYASAHHPRAAYQWSVELAVYVDSQAHRTGVGRALYSALLPLLSLQGFFNAYAGITLPNAASVGLHQALGFQPAAMYRAVGYKFGAWRDVGYWHRPLQDVFREPAAIASWSSIQEHPQCPGILQRGQAHIRL